MTTTTPNRNKLYSLATEYLEWHKQLLACDPSADAGALVEFYDIQTWGEEIEARARKFGFSWEQVEAMATDLEYDY